MSKSTKTDLHRKCPVTIGFNLSGRAKPIYCGQWTCPICAPKLAKKWAKRVHLHLDAEEELHLALGGTLPGRYWFITLTLGSRYRTTERGFAVLPSLWHRLHAAIRRKNPHWQYVAFVEGQPLRGWMPHFHIISSAPLPAKRNKYGRITKHALHNYAHKMGWGFEVTQEQVSTARNAAYISKYASKQSPKTPKGFRRVRPSRGWTKLDKDPTKRLLVRSRNEGLADFYTRVSDATGLDIPTVNELYVKCWQEHADKLGQVPFKW